MGLVGVLAAAVGATALLPSVAVAAALTWSAPRVIANQAPYSNVPSAGVSCPSMSLCLMRDSGGDIGVVRDPAGAATRTAFALPGIHSLELLQCPSSTMCIAADADGHLLTSTNPAAGARAWAISNLGRPLQVLSCPSASLCVAIDDQNNLVTSTDPSAGASAWTTTVMPSPLGNVSCPSAAFCVAVQLNGQVLTSTNPTGGVGAWIYSGGSGVPPPKLACPEPSFCVAGAGPGTIYATTSPTSSAPWVTAMVDGAHQIDSLACPTTTLCLAGDDGGNIITSTNPVGGPAAWTVANVDGNSFIQGLSCPSVLLCVAADGAFRVLVSTNPAAAVWTQVPFPGYDAFTSLACPSSSSCVAVDGFGSHVVTSSRPAGSWRLTRVTRGIGEDPQIWRVACASRLLCLALITDMGPPGASGATGTLYAFNPVGGAHSFRRLSIRGAEPSIGFQEVSCLRGPVCAALDSGDHVFSSTDPARAASWKRNRSARPWFAASCPTQRLCVALHSDPDQVVSSGEPPTYATATPTGSIDVFAGHTRTTVEIDPAGGLTGIDCVSKSWCVAVDDGGNVLSTSSPTGGPGTWTRSHVDDWPLAAVRCPSASLCVAVDRGGRAVVGRR